MRCNGIPKLSCHISQALSGTKLVANRRNELIHRGDSIPALHNFYQTSCPHVDVQQSTRLNMDTPQDSQGRTSSNSSNTGTYWPSLTPRSPVAPSPHSTLYPVQQAFHAPVQTTNSILNPLISQTGLPTPGPIDNIPPVPANAKVAIPRLSAPSSTRGRRRSTRACEPCRQRKIKCDGARPACGPCAYHNNRCTYEDVKRIRDQKMLELLSQRVEGYENLLRGLESEVDETTGWKIRKALRVSDLPEPDYTSTMSELAVRSF